MTIWTPDISCSQGPRYRAIAEAIGQAIRSGELKRDQRLPTHRALAESLGVTTGTVTRAYAEAERRGLVYGIVGRGTFVSGIGSDAESGQWQFLESANEGLLELNINRPLRENRADLLVEAMSALAAHPEDINRLLDYQPDIGIEAHRRVICGWIERDSWRPQPDQLVISNGGQHGIMVAMMALARKGDTVLAEELTYPGFAAITHHLELNVRTLAMDAEGIIPDALETACRQYSPRLLFCTPTLQNPTTATMSLERRQAVLDICGRHGVLVIEDDVSVGLAADGPLPMAALAPDRVIHIGGFSKTLAGGVRVGYLVVPESMQARLGAAVRASCWMASPLMVAVVCEWIRSGSAERLLQRQREELFARRRLALELLGEFDIASQPGGLHLWLKLPAPWRSEQFVRAAEARGILVMGAAAFTLGRDSSPHAVRISLSAVADRDRLRSGLETLGVLLRADPGPVFSVM